MPNVLRGPHHCVGIATSVTARIFHFLKTRSMAKGGSLSAADLDLAHADFMASLPRAANYFEGVDRLHMKASLSTAPEYFARETILVTMLIACSHKAARSAFPQIEYIGERWFLQLFGGIAAYIRENICTNADERLIMAYFELAMKLGGKLTVANLLDHDGARQILLECLAPLIAKDAAEELAEPLGDAVTSHIASVRGISMADPVKITTAEMQKFLFFLPLELRVELGLTAAA
jgi:hypothetical protein